MAGSAGILPARQESKGWYTRGYLPHLDEPGLTQFITFRLADSLPKNVFLDLEEGQDLASRASREMRALDGGAGECLLRRPEIATLVRDALLRCDGERYELRAWVIMPNHVHALARMGDEASLPQVVGGWKSYSALIANRLLRREGEFWAREFHDRYMRDDGHLADVVRYIERNPVKAGL